jgi:hypothetical protein
MDYADQVSAWQTLYATLASSAAALIGLLFVGLSLHLRTIVATAEHTARARETFGGLLSLLVLSIVLLIPGQERWILGGELLAGGLILVLVGGWLNVQTLRKLAPRRRFRWTMRLAVLHLGAAGVFLAAISLLVGPMRKRTPARVAPDLLSQLPSEPNSLRSGSGRSDHALSGSHRNTRQGWEDSPAPPCMA